MNITKTYYDKILKKRIFCEEHKKRISESQKGIPKKRESVEKMRIALTGVPLSEKRKKNISNSLKGRIFSEEHKQRLSNALKGRVFTDETKKKMSLNHFKHVSEETKLKIKNSTKGKINLGKKSFETKVKIGLTNKGKKSHLGKKHSISSRMKMRLSKIKHIQERIKNGVPIQIQIGKNEKYILDSIEKEKNIKLIRQYQFRGYFLDGYCKETNTVYEVDEPHHFDCEGNLKEHDREREEEIKQYLKCNFIRIKDVE